MNNIVTSEQGWLPLSAYAGASFSPYLSWLNGALAIWALLVLLCCWFLMFLFLLRCCCRRWRHRQYDVDRKSFRERLFDPQDQRNMYARNDQHFAAAVEIEDHLFESGSEEEITHAVNNVRLLATGLHPITIVSDKTNSGTIENFESNISKNYFINEKRNYFVQKDSSQDDEYHIKHNYEIQTFPGPTVTTINLAAERIIDDPNWEQADPFEIRYDGNEDLSSNLNSNLKPICKASNTRTVVTDPSLFQQDVKYEKQPSIYTHRPVYLEVQRSNEPRFGQLHSSDENDDDSTTSEMSGHDSESIHETIHVFTSSNQPRTSLRDEDVYKTADIDEVEIEIKDFVHSQKAYTKDDITYNDILSSSSTLQRN